MKLSTQKLIIFQTGIIKLCNKIEVKKDSGANNISPKNIGNPELEARVTKIENFLKAGNFVTVKQKKPESKEPPKPKYEGKVQDYWPKLVEDFKEKGERLMNMNLQGTVAKEINDMTLVIEFPNGLNPMAKTMLENPANKQNLKEMVHIACGKEMQIKFVDTKPQELEFGENSFESFAQKTNLNFNIIN